MTVMLVLIEGHSDRGTVALVQIVAQGWVRQGKGGRCGIPGGRWRNDGELSAPPKTPTIAIYYTTASQQKMKRSTKYRFLLPNVKNSILEPVFVTKQLFVLFIIDTCLF